MMIAKNENDKDNGGDNDDVLIFIQYKGVWINKLNNSNLKTLKEKVIKNTHTYIHLSINYLVIYNYLLG